MANEAFMAALLFWLAAAGSALLGAVRVARPALGLGAAAGAVGAAVALPGGSAAVTLPFGIADARWGFAVDPAAAWLMLLGLVPAAFAGWMAGSSRARPAWCFGAAASLVGALGIFGLQDAVGFLVAWELMSLGGAAMILGERVAPDAGRPSLFMLALLEVGSVALMVAMALLATATHGFGFAGFAANGPALGGGFQAGIGLLLLVGFGAKLGLLPFYEWFPGAYGSASGATGALMSGVVLNAAYFGLARGLADWIAPAHGPALAALHVAVVIVAVVSAILTALYAFQQDDWRCLLSFSSAENASLAVMLLGASLVFRRDGLGDLAGLAWIVALLHLGGHALAKGALFLCADGVFGATDSYGLRQRGLLRRAAWPLGLGALLAGGSLAAMPPQAGFVSEWYLFQTMFQGFRAPGIGDRLLFAAAGAGLALTAAIALATFVKVLGVGLLGAGDGRARVDLPHALATGALGAAATALAVGMPVWLVALRRAAPAGVDQVAGRMSEALLLVPLTSKFAFISPSELVIAMPLLAVVPLGLLAAAGAGRARRAPVWYGGRRQDPAASATTALVFSNALREFYSFVYRPKRDTRHDYAGGGEGRLYFVRRLSFTDEVAPIFGPLLFGPLERLTAAASEGLRRIQSGRLNAYLAFIGLLLVLILAVPLLVG